MSSLTLKKISFDKSMLGRKEYLFTPSKKEDLKRMIIQYNMKIKKHKFIHTNDNKNEIILNIDKHKEKQLNLMTPFLKQIHHKRKFQNNIYKEDKYIKNKINKLLSMSSNKESNSNSSSFNLNNINKKILYSSRKQYDTPFQSKLKMNNKIFPDISLMNNSFNINDSNKNHLNVKITPNNKIHNSNSQSNVKDFFEEKLIKNKRISYSNSFVKKIDDNIPMILPFAPIFKYTFSSNSEKERYQKNSKILFKLHYLINNNPENANSYITIFFKQKIILEDEYCTKENIQKFRNYLNLNIHEIDFREPLINIVKKILNIPIKNDENIIYYNQSMKSIFPHKQILKYNIKNKIGRKFIFNSQNLELNKILLKNINSLFSKESIIDYNDDQINSLQKEIDFLHFNSDNKETFTSRLVNRLYYQDRLLRNEKIEDIEKKKNKILEYIVLQNAKDQLNIRKYLDID